MRRNIWRLLAAGSMLALALGCSARNSRGYHDDPFASSRRGRSSAPSVAAAQEERFTPSRGAAPETTQAVGQAYSQTDGSYPKAVATGREQRNYEPDSVTTADRREAFASSLSRTGSMLDHSPDYSWVQGRLEYSAIGGGMWKVRYAPVSVDDQNGGSVILDIDPTKQGFQPGDTVRVQGQIASGETRRGLANPVYRVQHMTRAE